MTIGIYKITNRINGRAYIGQSVNIERRFMEHKTPKANGNDRLHGDIQRLGKETFSFEIIEECDKSELLEKERHYIRTMNPFYNHCGKPLSEEDKRKASVGTKRWWNELPEETKNRIINNNLTGPRVGHTVSEETRAKISRKVSEAQKQPVKVIETGQIFPSIKECDAAIAYPGACSTYFAGRIKSVKGYHVEKCRD